MRSAHKGILGYFFSGSLAALAVAGCEGDQATTTVPNPPPASMSQGVINGKLLFSTEPIANHRVDFYEFGDGATAVHESYPIEAGATGVLDAMPTAKDLATVFRQLQPKETIVPAVLLDADNRAAQAAAANIKRGIPVGEDANQVASAKAPAAPVLQAAAGTCSGDVLGDSWGASWFLNNYCNEYRFRYCVTNVGWGNTTKTASQLRWKQMEGDFNVAGHTKGTHASYDCCFICACGSTWHTDWDYDVLPRHVEIWTYTSSSPQRLISGSSPCGHMHLAELDNG